MRDDGQRQKSELNEGLVERAAHGADGLAEGEKFGADFGEGF
jgi:hypothetical protein